MDAGRISTGLAALAELVTATRAQAPLLAEIAARYAMTLRTGGKLLFAGNGGSAADAQHLATEYVVRLRGNRPALAALALTTDSSLLTAAANDLGFEQVFARQVEAVGRQGDLLILHSTSGKSPNLLAAARAARARGIGVVALVGPPGTPLAELADLVLVVGGDNPSHVQEIQLAVQHLIAREVEEAVAASGERWDEGGER
jgi:D-sedoheptulose 7-phosphate isomerase